MLFVVRNYKLNCNVLLQMKKDIIQNGYYTNIEYKLYWKPESHITLSEESSLTSKRESRERFIILTSSVFSIF